MAVSDKIDKISAILVVLEMINDLSKSSITRADIQAIHDYVYLLERI